MGFGFLDIVLILIVFYLINRQTKEIRKVREEMQRTSFNISSTHDLLNRIEQQLNDLQFDRNTLPSREGNESIAPQVEVVSEEIVIKEPDAPVLAHNVTAEFVEDIKESLQQEEVVREDFQIEEVLPVNDAVKPLESPWSWFGRFKQNNPDIERFIGENLINKIGILILVLGISFFVKYAIDKDWINEPARVGIGILCGAILLGVAHRLRLKYAAFSSVLVAGSISVFYFTIAIAFHDYALFSQTVAFILMIVITVFSTFVSIQYNRQELAILSLLGGFAVPFMVSTGVGNYHVLLTYLIVLNIGMLTISYFKRWFVVNIVAFVLTIAIYAGWYTSLDWDNVVMLRDAFVYIFAFHLIFSVAFAVNNVVHQNKFGYLEIVAIILNAAVFYGFGFGLVKSLWPPTTGIFTLMLGIYYILFAFILFRKYKFDKNIVYVLIGLSLTLATVTIPVQFSGNYITIFWACEAVLLFWLANKSQIRGFVLSGIIVQFLALVSLLIDLHHYVNGTVAYYFAINICFVTGAIVIVSLVATYKLFHKYEFGGLIFNKPFNAVSYRKAIFVTTILLGYILPIVEISYQANAFFYNEGTIKVFVYLYHMLFTTLFSHYLIKHATLHSKWRAGLVYFNMLLYIVFAYRIPILEMEEMFYYADSGQTFSYAMLLHYFALGCLAYQTWRFVKDSAVSPTLNLFNNKYLPWFVAFFIVYLLSVEVNIGFLFASDFEHYDIVSNRVVKVVFPVLWGVLSFVFLSYGIRQDMKQARVIALVLLGITILKLFLYDITEVSETGKIIAFILLGVLILIISFVYQKIKKLIVNKEDEDNS